MTQLAKSLGFNLADTLTGDIEFLADILKRAGFAVVKPETQANDFLLPRVSVSSTSVSCFLSIAYVAMLSGAGASSSGMKSPR